MRIVPISIRNAKAFVRAHHRHAPVVTGARLAIGLEDAGRLIGVGLLGNPKSRELAKDRLIAEATRVCVIDGAPKGATSKLNARLKRIWQLMGGVHWISYTLASESGASLRAIGATAEAEIKPRSWSCASRPRASRVIEQQPKVRWACRELEEVPL